MENKKCLQVEREVSFAAGTPVLQLSANTATECTAHNTLMDLRLAAIKQREGWQTEQDMRLNWTEERILSHYNMYYKHFELDAPASVVKDAALDELSDKEIAVMIRRWKFTDVLELLQKEGYLTVLHGHWILSMDMFLGCNE